MATPNPATNKHVYLIRHARQVPTDPKQNLWTVGAELMQGAEGKIVALAKYFHDHNIEFTHVQHSLLLRSIQTAYILRDEMGMNVEPKLIDRLGPGEVFEWQKRWDKLWRAEPGIELRKDIHWTLEFNTRWPDLCEREGERVLSAVSEIARGLQPGENAAAIGHNPLIALAQTIATGYLSGPELSYCQFVKFSFGEKNNFIGAEAYHVV